MWEVWWIPEQQLCSRGRAVLPPCLLQLLGLPGTHHRKVLHHGGWRVEVRQLLATWSTTVRYVIMMMMLIISQDDYQINDDHCDDDYHDDDRHMRAPHPGEDADGGWLPLPPSMLHMRPVWGRAGGRPVHGGRWCGHMQGLLHQVGSADDYASFPTNKCFIFI